MKPTKFNLLMHKMGWKRSNGKWNRVEVEVDVFVLVVIIAVCGLAYYVLT